MASSLSSVQSPIVGSDRSRVAWLTRAFCLTTGPVLILDGASGLIFAGTGFAVGDPPPHESWNFFFEFNSWHHAWHVLTGSLLLATGLTARWAWAGALLFGSLYAIQAPLGFLDGDDVLNLFYSAVRENLVHTALAIVGIALGLLSREQLLRRQARAPVRP